MWVLVGLAAVVVIVIAAAYNRLVTFRQAVRTSWSAIDAELQRRHDLLPNLVAVVRADAAHERSVHEAVARARAAGSTAQRSQAERDVVGVTRQLLMLAEGYPTLLTQPAFLDLQHQLVVTEDRIAAARRLFNNNVQSYNRRVQTLPLAVLAKLARFDPEQYLEFDRSIDEVPTFWSAHAV
jgi:LemA protein